MRTLLTFLILAVAARADAPNIVYILADDLGYGDLAHAGGKAATPHCDRLAQQGMRFTDAHTSSSVCTPTRYGILTGRYNWRSTLKKGVLNGTSPLLIPSERLTVAGFLKQHGYNTGCVGKWHLGIGWQKLAAGKTRQASTGPTKGSGWDVDYAKPVHGPLNNGFDFFFGIPASLDMPPYVYIKNARSTEIASQTKAFQRPGAAGAQFEAVNCLQDFAAQARHYIRVNAPLGKPFFLYVPLTSPHTPIVPSPGWQGKSNLGRYGDFLMETDWVVGEILAELKSQNVVDNTIVVFTADNGCSPAAKIPDLVKKGHKPNGDWRGHKADLYEGGHRVPFLARWPARIKSRTTSAATICTTDLFATVAEIVGKTIPNDAAEDSFSFLPDLLQTGTTARKLTIHHSINGSFAIRDGKWKLCLCPGSGGWSKPRPPKGGWKTMKSPFIQLFDLEADPAEQHNVQAEHPELVDRLVNALAAIIDAGRSTPGPRRTNDGPIPFNDHLKTKFPLL